MMKKIAVLVCAAVAAAVVAKGEGSLAPMGSYWSPKGFESNLGFGGKLVLGGPSFGLEVRGTFFEKLKENDGIANLDLQVIPLEAGLVLRAAQANVTPYIGGGAGYYFLDGKSNGGLFSVDDEVGWYATGGLELSLGKNMGIFGEALYRKVSGTAHGDNLNHVQSDVNIDLSGLVVNVGFAIHF